MNILDITGNGVSGNFDYFFNIGAQFTNDEKKDSRTFLLTNLKAGMSNNIHNINLGDIYREFSQYGLSISIKGGAYSFKNEGSGLPEFEFIYGYANTRWDNFHGFGQSYLDSIKRKVVGGKLKYNIPQDFKAGLSIVNTEDSERVNVSDELYNIISYTLGWECTIRLWVRQSPTEKRPRLNYIINIMKIPLLCPVFYGTETTWTIQTIHEKIILYRKSI